jgi:hypothetical protein
MKKIKLKIEFCVVILALMLFLNMLPYSRAYVLDQSNECNTGIEFLSEWEWFTFNEGISSPRSPEMRIVSTSNAGIVLEIETFGMEVREVSVEGNIYHMLRIPGCGYSVEVGKPEVPALRELIAIPPKGEVSVSVPETSSITLEGWYVFPSQEFVREMELPLPFTVNEIFYSTNTFYPQYIAQLNEPGIMRDFRIVQFEIHPLQFNPTTGELKVHTHMTLNLNLEDVELSTPERRRVISEAFEGIYSNSILNYDSSKEWVLGSGYWSNDRDGENAASQDSDLKDPNNRADYIILTYHSYYNSILPLADAKERRALEVMVVNDTEVYDQFPNADDVESIHDFLSFAYQNWALPPSYVEIIGDIGDIPMYLHSGDPGDHYYSCVDPSGNVYPDICVGRISAQTNSEVE